MMMTPASVPQLHRAEADHLDVLLLPLPLLVTGAEIAVGLTLPTPRWWQDQPLSSRCPLAAAAFAEDCGQPRGRVHCVLLVKACPHIVFVHLDSPPCSKSGDPISIPDPPPDPEQFWNSDTGLVCCVAALVWRIVLLVFTARQFGAVARHFSSCLPSPAGTAESPWKSGYSRKSIGLYLMSGYPHMSFDEIFLLLNTFALHFIL